MADNQNTANVHVNATNTQSSSDSLVKGFGLGMAAIALMALVAFPLMMGGLATVGGVGVASTGGLATGLQGIVGGAGAGAAFLFQAPGILAMGIAGLIGSAMAYRSDQQATAVANLAQQNAELKSQMKEQEQTQQTVNVQVDEPQHGGWRHRVVSGPAQQYQGAQQYAPMGYQQSFPGQPAQQYMGPPPQAYYPPQPAYPQQQQGYYPPQQQPQANPQQPQQHPHEHRQPHGRPHHDQDGTTHYVSTTQPQFDQQGFAAQELERRRAAQAQAMDPNMQGVSYV